MTKRYFLVLSSLIFMAVTSQAQVKPKPLPKQVAAKKTGVSPVNSSAIAISTSNERLVEIQTNYGTMIAKLYNATPLHRDNFIKLVQSGFYDSLLFHRVIKQFMIQGGDPASKNALPDQMLGNGSAPGERIPAEFNSMLFHKKGALAAARDNNPQKASSNCQFYIVEGKPITAEALQQQKNAPLNYTRAQTEVYARLGGAPFLDQGYTVFGEVISGLDVIDKIAESATEANNRPVKNVTMKLRLLN